MITFDLLKGYWQIPLTEWAKQPSAFVIPKGLYQYQVMPFSMRNAPATFQRMINQIVAGLDGCEAYIYDVIVYSNSWQEHIAQLQMLLSRFSEANFTINLTKSEFGHAEVTFLEHIVGIGQVKLNYFSKIIHSPNGIFSSYISKPARHLCIM